MVAGPLLWRLFDRRPGDNRNKYRRTECESDEYFFAEIEPVYIVGDFAVIPEQIGWSISAPVKNLTLGSWKAQKQPFYSWGVSYSKKNMR